MKRNSTAATRWMADESESDRLRRVCRGPAEAALGADLLRCRAPGLVIYPEAPLWVPHPPAGQKEELLTVDLLIGVREGDVRWLFVVECDGYEYHAGYQHFKDDRRRDRALLLSGLPVMRFPSVEILHGTRRCPQVVIQAFSLFRNIHLPQQFTLDEEARP